MLGDGITMALDFGYRWHDWYDAKWVLDRVADCDIYFAEAALQHDDLLGHARLAQSSPIRVAAPSSRPPASRSASGSRSARSRWCSRTSAAAAA